MGSFEPIIRDVGKGAISIKKMIGVAYYNDADILEKTFWNYE